MPSLVSLENLFGPEIKNVTVEDLLGMKSGVPDFDTAKPGLHPSDSFRAQAYENPNKEYGPEELLSEEWVKTGSLDFSPGTCDKKHYGNCYSSTNFVLLGMLLAQHGGVESWDKFD
jgi:CubicO group peptidase (beta-lactamase class C family)